MNAAVVFDTYLKNVGKYLNHDKDGNEKFLRLVEDLAGVSEPQADDFRRSLACMVTYAVWVKKWDFSINSVPHLQKACETIGESFQYLSNLETSDDVFYEVDGEEVCDEGQALSILLREEVLFANERETFYEGKSTGSTVVLYVLCNDVFVWGSADAENLPFSEIGNLYKAFVANKTWGVTKWCCIRRNEQPQRPIRERMKEQGVWDEQMESLPKNYDDKS